MKSFIAFILTSMTVSLFTNELTASQCNMIEAAFTSRVRGVCGGEYLPSSQTRRARNIELVCNSNSDSYIRTAYPIPDDIFREWFRLEQMGKQDEMQVLRQDNEPLIQWHGIIPYGVYEAWDWTECFYGTNGAECGYDHIQVGEDKDGNPIYEDIPRSCYYNVERSERRLCSNERMLYDSEFIRPPRDQSQVQAGKPGRSAKDIWNPATPGYHHVIPNKYDLISIAEIEAILTYNTGSLSSKMSPQVEFGDAWNEYKSYIQFDDGSHSKICESSKNPGHSLPLHFNVQIETIKRLIKRTPNAFRIPVAKDGAEIDPLADWEVKVKDGKDVRLKPFEVRLVDASSVIIDSMSRQSRKFDPELEAAKRKAGQGQTATGEELQQFEMQLMETPDEDRGFYKDTKVKLVGYRRPFLERPIRFTSKYYTDGSEAIAGRDQNRNDLYRLRLDDFYKPSAPFLEGLVHQFDNNVELVPGADYRLKISMFQSGVPFYKQSGSSKWSKALDLDFTRDKGYDQRSAWQRLRNWQGASVWKKPFHLFW